MKFTIAKLTKEYFIDTNTENAILHI